MKSRVKRSNVTISAVYFVQIRILFVWINIAKFYKLITALEFQERILK